MKQPCFAGGGSIPLEALRVGADAFASDLNPVAVLLNKVVLEYIPRHGQRLADEVRKWGEWIKQEAEKELAEFYPKDADGSMPIAYLWARTIVCEGPGCGAEIPLMRGLWLAKKNKRSVALKIIANPKEKRVDFEVIEDIKPKDVGNGTVKRGSATCPCCGYTTALKNVQEQLKKKRGGTVDARPLVVILQHPEQKRAFYRLPTERDLQINRLARENLEKLKQQDRGLLSLIPNEPTPRGGGSGAGRAFSQRNYGMNNFEDLFTSRQLLALVVFNKLILAVGERLCREADRDFAIAVSGVLAMALGKLADYSSSLCVWRTTRTCVAHTFGRQALPITWDFGEMNPFAGSAGDWEEACRYLKILIEEIVKSKIDSGTVELASATEHPLPDDSAKAIITDAPYYDAVPYADLSDFFYVWHKRSLYSFKLNLVQEELTLKSEEIIADPLAKDRNNFPKDAKFYELAMQQAMENSRRIVAPDGIGTVVFAHKSTVGWEALLRSLIEAGWTITASWGIDTERPGRLRANESAALASSIHLVCRPRENPDGSLHEDIGDWRDVLQELPQRIHDWMPRLASEGVVGADAIFACLGPALEIFSRYDSVEKASGEVVTLKEYLEYVWAAVSREALSTIFKNADASGFEEDARLTAMWLWTLSTGTQPSDAGSTDEEGAGDEEDDEETSKKSAKMSGYVLEFDAARKIAQGLGAHLEKLASLVQVKGDKARLLPVGERSQYLFGKNAGKAPAKPSKKDYKQLSLFDTPGGTAEEESVDWGDTSTENQGKTVLDRIHQSMILFAAGRSEALKRFLVDDGVGSDKRFWILAQALSALYPAGTDEKRWVDGVLARKKGLGF